MTQKNYMVVVLPPEDSKLIELNPNDLFGTFDEAFEALCELADDAYSLSLITKPPKPTPMDFAKPNGERVQIWEVNLPIQSI